MATAAHATASPARKVEGPFHYTGTSRDRRPMPHADADQRVGPGSTFTCLDTGDVDVFDGYRWAASPKSNAVANLLEAVLDEQRKTNALLETLLAHSVS